MDFSLSLLLSSRTIIGKMHNISLAFSNSVTSFLLIKNTSELVNIRYFPKLIEDHSLPFDIFKNESYLDLDKAIKMSFLNFQIFSKIIY